MAQADRLVGAAEFGDRRDLQPEHVEAVFLEFLGRTAAPRDVEMWMGIGSLRALLDGVLASEEYAARLAKRAVGEDAREEGPFLNFWVAGLERFTRPVGTISADGVAIVGARGHLFLYGGSNDNLAMYRGEIAMAPDWSEQWRELVAERHASALAAGRALCYLVVPDKLAVYADLFPQDLETGRPRPVMRLLEHVALPLLYPAGALRDARAGGDTYMMTDSHLTVAGNRLIAHATIGALGARPELLEVIPLAQLEQFASGDLGQHFTPPIMEVRQHLAAASAATIVLDNWPAVSRAGGHIGTLRIFRRDDAPDSRTVVIFGDSYGFGDEAYPGLSWFLAQVFREVHFVWAPFGWDPDYLDRVGAELVVCQTAERFIARVPRRRVDVQSLAQEIGERGGTLGLERVFGDAAVG
jgi:alginate O-acetyltransferase complex protein AlgJ